MMNRQLILQQRPKGLLAAGDLKMAETAVPELRDGQALARVKYLSIDPTMRVWMAHDSYLPAVQIGEVMRAFGFAEIVESRAKEFKKGDKVVGLTGLQEYVVIEPNDKRGFQKVPAIPFLSDTAFLGILGINGLTAFFGMEIGAPKKGETLVVSAAAGATGSIAGQIGKIRGCRVVGIAGTDEKCKWLTNDLGFDAAVNYKQADWREKFAAATPDGIDIDFENVGGEVMQEVLNRMNLFGRVVLCGLISGYTKDDPGLASFGNVLVKRLRVQGFIVLDFASRFMEAATQLGQWKMFGKIKDREMIVEGLEKAPEAINMLFTGANTGKLIVKV
ncbi:MAG TPA: NADP-dependent oxidoreductase [Candidatus Acidoferrales bacterium]|nr:NADP-dependent oxidoreductase [Candidatus Acidoferrales bacterium]